MKKNPSSANSTKNIFNSAGVAQNLHYWTSGDLPTLTYDTIKKLRNLKLLSAHLLIACILIITSCRNQHSELTPGPQEMTEITVSESATAISTLGALKVIARAGNGVPGMADGQLHLATFNSPSALAIDEFGNVYVADMANHAIRWVTRAGVVRIAGNGLPGIANGSSTAAQFNNPSGVAVDAAGNVYVADKGNHAIRKIDPFRNVTNFAGVPNPQGQGFADGPASSAKFNNPSGLAVDASGNLLVADRLNHVIRKITPEGNVTTLAGMPGEQGFTDGPTSSARFNNPSGVAIDDLGKIYVADAGNNRIRIISTSGSVTTLAGGNKGSIDGPGTFAQFNAPVGVAVDASRAVYVADSGNNKIRIIRGSSLNTSSVSTFAGDGTPGFANGAPSLARFKSPLGVAVDTSGQVFVADRDNHSVRQIGVFVDVSTFLQSVGSESGVFDSFGNLYVCEMDFFRILKVTPTGEVSTFAGGTFGFADGPGMSAMFKSPDGIAIDGSGNLYVADKDNQRIRKITPEGLVSTLAGNGTTGFRDGKGSLAFFYFPSGVTLDRNGNLYVADAGNNRIRKITPDGTVTTLAGSGTRGFADGFGSAAMFATPRDVALDTIGNIYVADAGNNRIRKITPEGLVSTLAGSSSANVFSGEYTDGPGNLAKFYGPGGLDLDISGNVYVADGGNHLIRKITPEGVVSTLAGSPNFGFLFMGGYFDGPGPVARFNSPSDVTIGIGGLVYVMERYNGVIRKIQ